MDGNLILSAMYRPDAIPGRIVELALGYWPALYAQETVLRETVRALTDGLGLDEEYLSSKRAAIPANWLAPTVCEDFVEETTRAVKDASYALVVSDAIRLGCCIANGDGDFHALRTSIVATWTPRGLQTEID